jgi:FlaA1/EpsC-like NDP-sugar epimerase
VDRNEIAINVTGLRPGEKLHERLFFADERAEPTEYAGILRAVSERGSSPAADARWVQQIGEMATVDDDVGIRAAFRAVSHLKPSEARSEGG